MIHDVDAIYDQGVFRPLEPLALPEGAQVRLRVEEENGAEQAGIDPVKGELPTLLERLKKVVGTVDICPTTLDQSRSLPLRPSQR